MMEHSIFHRTEQSDRVDAEMLIEPFVLGVHQCTEELRVDFFILDGGSVLVEILSNQLAVGAVYFKVVPATSRMMFQPRPDAIGSGGIEDGAA